MRKLVWFAGLALLAGLMLAGCSGSGGNGSTGTVKLLVADAPLRLDSDTVVNAVTVAITRVELLTDDTVDSPHVTLFSGNEVINLLDFANKPIADLFNLGLAAAPAGTYHQLRLIVDESQSSVTVNGTPQPLVVASGEQTGFKIPIDFTVAAGSTEMLLLDFDVQKLHQDNQFKLTPNAIRVSQVGSTGTVTGTLALPLAAQPASDVTATITLHAPGASLTLASTTLVLTAETASAPFYFHGVPAGNYVVSAAVQYGTESAQYDSAETAVTEGATADLGAKEIGYLAEGGTFTLVAPPPAPEPETPPAE